MRDTTGPAMYAAHDVYSWDQAVAAVEKADSEDLECGGVYDAHSSAAISIWAQPWSASSGERPANLVGTIFWNWGEPEEGRVVVYGYQVGPDASLRDVEEARRDALRSALAGPGRGLSGRRKNE